MLIYCKQGDNTDILLHSISGVEVDISNITAVLVLKDIYGAELLTRPITDVTGKSFKAFLTPDETSTLPPGEYKLIVELTSSVTIPPINLESIHTVEIIGQNIP